MKILDHVYMITMIREQNGVLKEGICYSAPATNKTDAWANFLRQEEAANALLPATFNRMKAVYKRKGYSCTKVIVGVEG